MEIEVTTSAEYRRGYDAATRVIAIHLRETSLNKSEFADMLDRLLALGEEEDRALGLL